MLVSGFGMPPVSTVTGLRLGIHVEVVRAPHPSGRELREHVFDEYQGARRIRPWQEDADPVRIEEAQDVRYPRALLEDLDHLGQIVATRRLEDDERQEVTAPIAKGAFPLEYAVELRG